MMDDDVQRRELVLERAHEWADLLYGVNRLRVLEARAEAAHEDAVPSVRFDVGRDPDEGAPMWRLIAPTEGLLRELKVSRRRSGFLSHWDDLIDEEPALEQIVALTRQVEDEALAFGRLCTSGEAAAARAAVEALETALDRLEDSDLREDLETLTDVATTAVQDGDVVGVDSAIDLLCGEDDDAVAVPRRLTLRAPDRAAHALAVLEHTAAWPWPPSSSSESSRVAATGRQKRTVAGRRHGPTATYCRAHRDACDLLERHPLALFRSVHCWVRGLQLMEHHWDHTLLRDISSIPPETFEEAAVVIVQAGAGSADEGVRLLEQLAAADRSFELLLDPLHWLWDHETLAVQAISALQEISIESAERHYEALTDALAPYSAESASRVAPPSDEAGGSAVASGAITRAAASCSPLPPQLFKRVDAARQGLEVAEEALVEGPCRIWAHQPLVPTLRRHHGRRIHPDGPLERALRVCEMSRTPLSLWDAMAPHPGLARQFDSRRPEEWSALTEAAADAAGAVTDHIGLILFDPANRDYLVEVTRWAVVAKAQEALDRARVPIALVEGLRGIGGATPPTAGAMSWESRRALAECTLADLVRLEGVLEDLSVDLRLLGLTDEVLAAHVTADPERAARFLGEFVLIDTGLQEQMVEAAGCETLLPVESPRRRSVRGLVFHGSLESELRHY